MLLPAGGAVGVESTLREGSREGNIPRMPCVSPGQRQPQGGADWRRPRPRSPPCPAHWGLPTLSMGGVAWPRLALQVLSGGPRWQEDGAGSGYSCRGEMRSRLLGLAIRSAALAQPTRAGALGAAEGGVGESVRPPALRIA